MGDSHSSPSQALEDFVALISQKGRSPAGAMLQASIQWLTGQHQSIHLRSSVFEKQHMREVLRSHFVRGQALGAIHR